MIIPRRALDDRLHDKGDDLPVLFLEHRLKPVHTLKSVVRVFFTFGRAVTIRKIHFDRLKDQASIGFMKKCDAADTDTAQRIAVIRIRQMRDIFFSFCGRHSASIGKRS